MPTFNLIEQNWIPCLRFEDSSPTELGIYALLLESHKFREVADPSPLVTAAIHRLLIAILHRALNGPRNTDEWQKLWSQGQWEAYKVGPYLDQWQHHFDLFHPSFPFYQTTSLDAKYASPISRMAVELARGNNPTLFDHSVDQISVGLSPAEAARLLVTLQAFDVGGLISFEKGQDRKIYGSSTNAPLTKGCIGILKGENLFQTLLLNLHRYCPEDGEPFDAVPDDTPAWERDGGTQSLNRPPKGYLDLLTWQSRRVRLIPAVSLGSDVLVSHAVVMKGSEFPVEWSQGEGLHGKETMLTFLKVSRPSKGQAPWQPLSFQPQRSLWRDSYTLLQLSDESGERLKTINWLEDLVSEGILASSFTVQIDCYGMSTNRAKVDLWRHERLPLPLAYLKDPELLERLKEGLEIAEQGGGILRSSLWVAACNILFPGKEPESLSRENKNRAGDLVSKSLNPEAPYWSQLEGPFKSLMVTLAEQWDSNSHDPDDSIAGARHAWAEVLGRAARRAFTTATSGLESSPRSLKALAIAQRAFNARLAHALENYTGPTDLTEGGENIDNTAD